MARPPGGVWSDDDDLQSLHSRVAPKFRTGSISATSRPQRVLIGSAARRRAAHPFEIGRALKDEDGAGAIVMGCAGMARLRRPLEDALGIPVIDPTQAALAMALGAVQFSRH